MKLFESCVVKDYVEDDHQTGVREAGQDPLIKALHLDCDWKVVAAWDEEQDYGDYTADVQANDAIDVLCVS